MGSWGPLFESNWIPDYGNNDTTNRQNVFWKGKFKVVPNIAGNFSSFSDFTGIHSLAASLIPSRIGIQTNGVLFTVYIMVLM